MKEQQTQQNPHVQTYYKLIQKALPEAMIHIKTKDYFAIRYERGIEELIIVPEPFYALQLSFKTDEPYNISISKVWVYKTDDFNAKSAIIFEGQIPADGENGPDFDLIEKVLKNYRYFSIPPSVSRFI